jgi:hypothetical protein
MDPVPRSTTVEQAFALFDRIKALTAELRPLDKQYSAWAREYDLTGVPHNRDEFSALLERIKALRAEIRDTRNLLAAMGGGR